MKKTDFKIKLIDYEFCIMRVPNSIIDLQVSLFHIVGDTSFSLFLFSF